MAPSPAPGAEEPQPPAALLSMSGIARLAKVRRPVVTIWRRRKAQGPDPFPAPVNPGHPELQFDATEIAAWLTRTGLGNNASAQEDLAAHVRPGPAHLSADFDAAVAALLTLTTLTGASLTETVPAELLDLADDVDPHDEFCYREVEAAHQNPELVSHAEQVADASYSAANALEQSLQEARRRAPNLPDVLSRPALRLLADLAIALHEGDDGEMHFADPFPQAGDLLAAVRERLPEHIPAVAHTPEVTTAVGRNTLRRLLSGGWGRRRLSGELGAAPSAVVLTQVDHEDDPRGSALHLLRQIDDIALEMHAGQRAVIVGPAQVLIDELADREADNLRAHLLRLDRVRSIIRLPAGSVPRRHNRAMAVWVLGATHPGVPAERRWTTVCDLTDRGLTPALCIDVVNDTLAAMGDEQTVRSHAFHYSRRVAARSVIAAHGPLIPGPTTAPPRPATSGSHTAARLMTLAERLDSEPAQPLAPAVRVFHASAPTTRRPSTHETIEHWLDRGDLELIPGHRLSGEPTDEAGVPVLGADQIMDGSLAPAQVHIDLLTLAEDYPAAHLSEPGDVILTTTGGLRAAVDHEGSALVTYPARILRPTETLDPHLLARALNRHGATGGRAWRSVTLRPVPESQRKALREAMAAVDNAHRHAHARIAALKELRDDLLDGIAARVLQFDTPTTAPPEGH
ncbi:hypothetical protein [Pseudactinotalea sp. Z1732]|uniref:hypothetical protein n=1 Tax=Pseudactinotalea sp. Z1732 TaxID=3413026 RepID=UPI003C7BF21E